MFTVFEQFIKLLANPMKRQYLQMMFCGVQYLQRIPKNNAFDAVDGTYVDNSNIHPFFCPLYSGED